MKKNDVCIYIRDNLGNIDIIDKYKSKLCEFATINMPNLEQKVFIDKGCVLNSERDILNDLYKHIQEKHTKWVIVPHIDRFYKINYENGFQKPNDIVNKILSYGTGIVSYNEGKVLTSNNKVFELSNYKFKR